MYDTILIIAINAERGVAMFPVMIVVWTISGFISILPLLLLFQTYMNRRDCSMSMKHNIGVHIFAFYNAAVLGVTGIPSVNNIRIDFNINLIPFLDIGTNFIQYVQNAALFMPMGFLVPLIWKQHRNWKSTMLCGFLVSLAVELAQLLCYRATDIDDLIMNTLGTFIGYAVFKLLECKITEWFPPKFDKHNIEAFIKPPVIAKYELLFCILIFWFAIFFIQGFLSSFLSNQYF